MQLLARRRWSLAVRRALPPEQYAGVLSPENEVRKTSLQLLRKRHDCLLKWEDDVANDLSLKESVVAQQLKENVCFAVNHPARLMMDAIESIDYDHRRLRGYGHKTSVVLGQNHKEAGEHLLQTLIQTFPDNKIVEDVHNALRLEARANKHNKLTPSTMQSVCMSSGVLESRCISHEAEVAESEFIQSLGESGGAKEIYWSKARVLPEEYITIYGVKSWSAFTEVIGNSCSSLGLAPISVSDPFGLWQPESHFRSLQQSGQKGPCVSVEGPRVITTVFFRSC